jgi:glycosidase
MATRIETNAPNSLQNADLTPRGNVFPSPEDWRDQTLYFLLPDRFSDGNESGRTLFDRDDPTPFKAADKKAWMIGGRKFQGGTLKGIKSKLKYLKSLGVTALWIGPIWKQRADMDTYHGYGIQNFLEVDPRFGTRQDLRNLVDAAHDLDMYVLLDVIYNHSGNNWFYNVGDIALDEVSYRFSPPYDFHSWRSGVGGKTDVINDGEDGVWPMEFQQLSFYTRAGKIGKWDPEPWENPLHPDNEFRRGDFFSLKDLKVDSGDVLESLVKAYQYWIALSDCDGFRIDTVKHVSWEASRNFCGAIHEYAESIGKQNFLLLGEVTGGAKMARDYIEVFGRNLDAVLDIGDPAVQLASMVKGANKPFNFFNQFKEGHDILGTHRETGRYHVSILDDHDMVGRGGKHRFASGNTGIEPFKQVAHAVGVQLTTLGIPCIYYGTEQAFDGSENNKDENADPGFEDRFIRESMFGGTFGAFQTEGCHFFDPNHPAYLRIAAIARVRNRKDQIGLALRKGRLYLRETSFLNKPYALPEAGELTGWSRILLNQEVIMALNTNGTESRGAKVTIDARLNKGKTKIKVLYNSEWSDRKLKSANSSELLPVINESGRLVVNITLPPSGMIILAS